MYLHFQKSILNLLFFAALCLSSSVFGQEDKIINYLQNEFKVNQQIWGIHSNPKNDMVYYATNIGLLEFDGLSFQIWENPAQKMIRSVMVDSSGLIFTGGFESFGFWQKDNLCHLKYHPLTDSFPINKNDEIWKIYFLNGAVYFQSFTAIYKYDYKKITTFPSPEFMLFMFQIRNQLIVQVLDKGLYTFKNDVLKFIPGSEQFSQKKVHSIIPYINNQMLICTEKNGIYLKHDSGFAYWNSAASEYLKLQNCNAAAAIGDSVFAFGTILDGIILTDHLGKIEERYNYGNGLNNNTVLSFFVTQKQGLWVGLDEGINFINQGSKVSYFTTANGSLGSIYTILIDENTLYMGSNHGLFQTQLNLSDNNLHFQRLSLVPNSQGQVWTLGNFDHQIICGHNEGTFQVKGQQFTKISSITGGWVIKAFEDKLIEGTYTGLVTLEKDPAGNWSLSKRIEGYYEPTRHLEVDYLGYIWVSHPQKGIFRLQPNESMDTITGIIPFTDLKKSIGLMDVYKLNNRVVFSTGKEFYTYDYVNAAMVPFTALNNALGEYRQASQIIPNEKNQYWFIYKNKLALFRISIEFEPTKICEYLITDANMPGQDLTILSLKNSNFIVSNRNGLALLRNDVPDPAQLRPSMYVKSIFFQGKNKNITICPNQAQLEVPHYVNNVQFSFADPDAINLTTGNYLYRIIEIEDYWNSTQNPVIQYYHLNPGTYHLQMASDSNTKFIETEFTILPPWYLNKWAFITYFLIILAIAYLLVRYFKTKLQKQRKLLEFEIKQTSLENRLQNTNVELMLTLRYLIQKNESLQNLRGELDAIKGEPGSVPTKFIKKLDIHITQGLELQTKEWKMALHNLKLSQEGYFKMLKEKYPKLTNNDIRLCSYLRMNFSSKEIAQLLNISTRAVEISRYRLRKKLNLDHDKSLTDFLIQDEI
ncbi:MAG TPA: hypothetical protein DCQ26_01925 [Marinilabiliales bacterium]|nr:MAG: hypothetical protein A2W84_06830 [Bacteroidetes bacterium GWC2_40_13]OFX74399.1 MAG: hypothetical protein A2W96_13830 [Bacteroidetes bacterium GWD2_40_43]OFX95188.1 MAG: hypothetical protein A2W97_11335 [Bacteroidetes bacterium GWE2_40_63]OFY21080.1 MAG: hypothetical protein A2W88_18505 [Bacteroidetes bacterium GWF2_40_13]OFZ30853.1 MAG: hypothetical protein A2437_11755 [Bacteroidetes bacterium RIFOXYC2_FULL_40_12]HAM97343.1 hypothetical protein [Marinilabiliales bacterium]